MISENILGPLRLFAGRRILPEKIFLFSGCRALKKKEIRRSVLVTFYKIAHLYTIPDACDFQNLCTMFQRNSIKSRKSTQTLRYGNHDRPSMTYLK